MPDFDEHSSRLSNSRRSSGSAPFISLVIPAYNEVQSIVPTLNAVSGYLDQQPWTYELLVMADGDDGTRESALAWAAGDPGVIVLGRSGRHGKGLAVRTGVLRARGEIIGFIDADCKTPIEELGKLLPWLRADYDIAVGSRKLRDAKIGRPQPLHRRFGSSAFAMVLNQLVDVHGVRDTQCGFKFFRREPARRIFSLQRIDGYMFDVEILHLAALLNYRVREVGVRWQDDGDSRYDPIWGTLRNARELLRIRRMQYDLAA